MGGRVSISEAARRTGLSTSAIRHYEAKGIVSPAGRSAAGYRLFAEADVRRLLLAKQARLLGMTLPDTRTLVTRAFSSDCDTFASELAMHVAAQRAAVATHIAELRKLEATLAAIAQHIDSCACPPGTAAAECASCLMVGGEEVITMTAGPCDCGCDCPCDDGCC
jgi:DNA-binding transcriptional MerR regulator